MTGAGLDRGWSGLFIHFLITEIWEEFTVLLYAIERTDREGKSSYLLNTNGCIRGFTEERDAFHTARNLGRLMGGRFFFRPVIIEAEGDFAAQLWYDLSARRLLYFGPFDKSRIDQCGVDVFAAQGIAGAGGCERPLEKGGKEENS